MTKTPVHLSDEMMNAADKYATVFSRSISLQIEHWARIGKIAEENPDLPYAFIENILGAKAEVDNGEFSIFEFRHE
jgi:predicted negative regulator of RcsB-dependent stress response